MVVNSNESHDLTRCNPTTILSLTVVLKQLGCLLHSATFFEAEQPLPARSAGSGTICVVCGPAPTNQDHPVAAVR